jgi:hypothetical protein
MFCSALQQCANNNSSEGGRGMYVSTCQSCTTCDSLFLCIIHEGYLALCTTMLTVACYSKRISHTTNILQYITTKCVLVNTPVLDKLHHLSWCHAVMTNGGATVG